jgi:hypothetical protein
MTEGINVRCRYEHGYEIPTTKIGWYLRRVKQKRRTLAFHNGDPLWVLPRAEIRLFWITTLTLTAGVLALLVALICRGLR